MPTRVPWPAVGAYILVSYGLAWLVALPLWLDEGLANPLAPMLLIALMFTPTAGTLVAARLVQRPRPAPLLTYLGIWPLRPTGRTIGLAAVGLFGSILISVASVLLAAALGFVRLDLVGFSGFAELLRRQLEAAGGPAELPAPVAVLVIAQLAAIPVGALINSLFAFGEEVGWRGWLLPSLRPLGIWPALLLSGAVWGLWHAPVILLGYNFGRTDLVGMAYMVLGCTAYGTFVGWLRLRSGSVWPAVVAHGAFNASANVGMLLLADGSPGTPVDYLPLGWPGWVVCALLVGGLVATRQFHKEGALRRG